MDHPQLPAQPERRDFLTKTAAVVVGGAIVAVPAVAGLCVLFDPLRRQAAVDDAVFVGSLTALPENGEPRKFAIQQTQVDVWSRTPNVPVGGVYLQRTGDGKVRALNAKCPHAGCFVNFKGDRNCYHCPCHDSTFATDGSILDPKSPSARALDELTVEIRNGSEIWVRFQNFRAGVKEKVPV